MPTYGTEVQPVHMKEGDQLYGLDMTHPIIGVEAGG